VHDPKSLPTEFGSQSLKMVGTTAVAAAVAVVVLSALAMEFTPEMLTHFEVGAVRLASVQLTV